MNVLCFKVACEVKKKIKYRIIIFFFLIAWFGGRCGLSVRNKSADCILTTFQMLNPKEHSHSHSHCDEHEHEGHGHSHHGICTDKHQTSLFGAIKNPSHLMKLVWRDSDSKKLSGYVLCNILFFGLESIVGTVTFNLRKVDFLFFIFSNYYYYCFI